MLSPSNRRRVFVGLLCALVPNGCSGGATIGPSPHGGSPGSPPSPGSSAPGATPSPGSSPTVAPASPIKHIVIIIQENRTFDNLFHGFVDPHGRKADTVDTWVDKDAGPVTLASLPLATVGDPGGGYVDFAQSYDGGKNDGFKAVVTREAGSNAAGLNYGYAFVRQTDIQPYWDLATNGALAQRFFHGVRAPTWPSHLMFAAGSTTYNGNPSFRAVDNPSITTGWGCEDLNTSDSSGALDPSSGTVVKGPYPCLSGVTTIADLLQNAGRTWHYYSGYVPPPGTSIEQQNLTPTTPGGNLNAFASYHQLYFGPTWASNTIIPETRILTDAPTQTLADLTYVVPEAYNSDHSNSGSQTGPQWVAAVCNAIGESANWNSTAIFITWDDYGGWFDHVPPPQLDAYGLSFRIPLIAISPYAKHQLIDTQYEPGSVLKFVEETFGLPSLGTTDVRANSVRDMFDFAKSPEPYKPVLSAISPAFFVRHPPDPRPVDQ